MVDPRIINYLRKNLARGFSEKQLKNKLIKTGWPESSVKQALNQIHGKPKESKKSKNKTIFYFLGGIFIIIIIFLGLFFFNPKTEQIPSEDLNQGTSQNIEQGKSKKFTINQVEHEIKVKSIQEDKVTVEIRSDPIELELKVGEVKKVNLDDDNYYDLELKAESTEEDSVKIYMKEINEQSCTPEWECSEWSSCINETQTRNCSDINRCGIEEGKPKEIRKCNETCEQNWTCTNWSECINETQTRDCTDENKCGNTSEKPKEIRECISLKNCSELNGTLCNSSEICNGTELNSSDNSICCDKSCVIGSNKPICSEGYYHCNSTTSFHCNASLEEGPGKPICCSERCLNMTEYLGRPFWNISYSKNISTFKGNVSDNCKEGYNITTTTKIDKGFLFGIPTGIIIKSNVYYELKGLNSRGNCTVLSEYTDYKINYTSEIKNHLRQMGNTTEEINKAIQEKKEESESIIGVSAVCHYPQNHIIDKIEGWEAMNFSSNSADFQRFNCSGNRSAPII
ncbi:MAG TPA: hypothetical protein VJ912_01415 [Candidatus Nanoarchaeia archaeon]|nr:hypothetical protein [Candidatus Nanoarchaeia archaeon]